MSGEKRLELFLRSTLKEFYDGRSDGNRVWLIVTVKTCCSGRPMQPQKVDDMSVVYEGCAQYGVFGDF